MALDSNSSDHRRAVASRDSAPRSQDPRQLAYARPESGSWGRATSL